MLRKEVASQHHMTLLYRLANAWKLDSFRKMSKKEYTFDNGRAGACSEVLHINKFLVSQELDMRGGRIEAAKSVRNLSNHSPLMITISGQLVDPLKQKKYFDSSLLSDEKCKVIMLHVWEGETPKPTRDIEWAPWLEGATQRVMAYNALLVKE